MATLIQKLGSIVKGTLSGFDRIVFKGNILPLMHEAGVSSFLYSKGILNKDYKAWMTEQTSCIVDRSEVFSQQHTGQPITYITSYKQRKEEIARQRQEELGISQGLIGVWSAVESCMTYKARFSRQQSFPKMCREWSKCKHLYFYFDHPTYGFMNIRLQTWFPYHIQIAMNGREWLTRELQKKTIAFNRHKNKILFVEDYSAAQKCLDRQLNTRWDTLLNSFLQIVFPDMPSILGPYYQPYWTLWQSEWATDHIFESQKALLLIGENLILQAFLNGTTPRVLRYFDRPLTKEGNPYVNMSHNVESRLLQMGDGLRVRHWVGQNSVKVYTEQNVLRTETTINNPGMFKVHRHAQGEGGNKPKRYLPLRKGIADIPMRAKISEKINHRMNESLACLKNDLPVNEMIKSVCRRHIKNGRPIRSLDLLGKDKRLLCALADPSFVLNGVSNRELREALADEPGWKGRTEKQQSAKMSRMIRLLRDHGILHKCPKQNRYRLSPRGHELTIAINATLHASTQELIKIAA